MANKKGQLEVIILVLVLLVIAGVFGVGMYLIYNNEEEQVIKEDYLVTRIIDGDTFELESGDKVRIICIDTPERGDYYYKEATEYLKQLILNKKVSLEVDTNNKDRYGRLLRWVWINETLINEEIVRNGYGVYYEYPPDVKYCPEIEQAQGLAELELLGLWSNNNELE